MPATDIVKEIVSNFGGSDIKDDPPKAKALLIQFSKKAPNQALWQPVKEAAQKYEFRPVDKILSDDLIQSTAEVDPELPTALKNLREVISSCV